MDFDMHGNHDDNVDELNRAGGDYQECVGFS
jgi:hypothetical protein